jgi:hypothetical protein
VGIALVFDDAAGLDEIVISRAAELAEAGEDLPPRAEADQYGS